MNPGNDVGRLKLIRFRRLFTEPEIRQKCRKYEQEGFKTPTGKAELYSRYLAGMGYSPLPTHLESPETRISDPELAAEYPLVLITGGRNLFHVHSQMRDVPSLKRKINSPFRRMAMDTGEICRLYENSSLRRVAGGVLRPGGFDLTDRAVDFCGFRPGSRVLDLGCGTGATVAHLVDKYNLRAAGIDPSAALLACGRKSRPDLPLIQAAAENLPFLPGRMDGIFAECTLSVVNNPDGALKECYRVLRDGGWLVITDIYAGNPEAAEELRTLPLASCITGAMTRHDLDYKLNNAGFSTVLWEDHAHLLKDLVIKIIMSHGSMQNFWRQAGPDDIDAGRVQEVVKKARPGYFLLIARKSGALL